MARPQRCRTICVLPEHTSFVPADGAPTGEVELSLDEYQAMRLMDCKGCTHEQCAELMRISRTTATEIYASARKKVAEAIINGRRMVIGGGSVRLCDRDEPCGLGDCPRLSK